MEKVITEEIQTKIHSVSKYQNPDVKVSNSKIVEGQQALTAQDFISANSVIFIYTGEVTSERTRTSIQVSKDKHLEAGDFGSFTNHSCAPNALLVCECTGTTAKVALITVKNVFRSDEITFDYATSETELTKALHKTKCLCGSNLCRKQMLSFSDLDAKEQERLYRTGLLTKHVKDQYLQSK